MRFNSLAAWLEWQDTLHPEPIDLGLERVRAVFGRMGRRRPAPTVLTVGGTNGKGSVVAYLDAILRRTGYTVGTFTSPHLIRYNERVRVNGQPADDDALMAAFDAIDRAREDETLTFFEWNALAAFTVFERAAIDVAVLEVGLGGRLDAVNIIDADVAAVVSVGLDHCEWLGQTVELIGREKAGIFRNGQPAVFGSRRMPISVGDVAATRGARLRRLGVDFDFVERPDGWDYVGTGSRRGDLPLPPLAGVAQLANAATALAVLEAAEPGLLVPDEAVRGAFAGVSLAGRFQVVPGTPEWVLDVAHNPDAARVLRQTLEQWPTSGRTHAVCGVLADKDIAAIIECLLPVVDSWRAVGLAGPRAVPVAELAARIQAAAQAPVAQSADVAAGCAAARDEAGPGDRILVFGSFHTVGPALEFLGLSA